MKEELDKACNVLSNRDECKQMVNDYVDMIVKMLVEYAEPEKVCEAIHKCPSQGNVQAPKEVDSPCQLCIYIIDEVRVRLANKKTEAEIKEQLDQLCNTLPEGSDACKVLVNDYLDVILEGIVDQTNPEKVCQVLRQCPRRIQLAESATGCDLCKVAMEFVANELKNEDTDDKIIEVVEKVCALVPESHRLDCYRMIEIDGMILVRMIAESVDPSTMCETIRFCPR